MRWMIAVRTPGNCTFKSLAIAFMATAFRQPKVYKRKPDRFKARCTAQVTGLNGRDT